MSASTTTERSTSTSTMANASPSTVGAGADPETGGQYTLKRWRVTKHTADGGVEQIEVKPDKPGFVAKRYTSKDGAIRPVAELVEVVG